MINRFKRMRILAIDDNTVNLATLEQELKPKYEVIPMISGRRAIRYLYQEQVDLILLDVEMPIMDGIETLKEIRSQENGVTVPVIFLTAKKDKATVVDGAKLGIMDYITKPFDPDDLHERIERVFKRLGVLPMEEEEIYRHVVEILKDMKEGHVRQAMAQTEEVLNYQLDSEISGRIRNVLSKLRLENMDSAIETMERVVEYLDQRVYAEKRANARPISKEEVCERLESVLAELAEFKRKEAVAALKELQTYAVSGYVQATTDEVIHLLSDYDEVQAEAKVKQLLIELREDSLNAVPKENENKTQAGYHMTINK